MSAKDSGSERLLVAGQSEPQALAGFDIRRYRPELVCIEAAPRIRERILAYFSANGYERIEEYLRHDSVNWYFRPATH